MDYYIINGKVYHDHAFQEIPLRVVDGKLSLCGGVPAGAETVDASGMKIVPGFIAGLLAAWIVSTLSKEGPGTQVEDMFDSASKSEG